MKAAEHVYCRMIIRLQGGIEYFLGVYCGGLVMLADYHVRCVVVCCVAIVDDYGVSSFLPCVDYSHQ